MDAIKSRNPCKNSAAGNSIEGGHSSWDNRNITASRAEGRPATTVLASAGTPAAQHERHQLVFFAEIRQKVVRTARNSRKKEKGGCLPAPVKYLKRQIHKFEWSFQIQVRGESVCLCFSCWGKVWAVVNPQPFHINKHTSTSCGDSNYIQAPWTAFNRIK
jgi:hypothetical protein